MLSPNQFEDIVVDRTVAQSIAVGGFVHAVRTVVQQEDPIAVV